MLDVILSIFSYAVIGAVFTGILLRNSHHLQDGMLITLMILVWPVFAVMMIPVWIFQVLVKLTQLVGNWR